MRPVGPQLGDGLHPCQRQQAADAVSLKTGKSIIKVRAPAYGRILVGVDALHTHYRQIQRLGDRCHRAVQLRRKRMRRINQQPDAVSGAERRHRSLVHSTGDMRAVETLDLLQVAARRVPIRRSRRIGHPDRQPAFSRAAEYQYHRYLRNRCLNSCA